MIAVVFEALPARGQRQRYLDLAAALEGELGPIDGSISVEHFQCLADPDRIRPLSSFRDEDAVALRRNIGARRATQRHGRVGVLADYRLHVVEVVRDYCLSEREQAPVDSRTFHHPTGSALHVADKLGFTIEEGPSDYSAASRTRRPTA